MAENISKQQLEIRVGTHGEDYGSWMSNPVFYVFGGLVLLAAVLAVLSFTTFHLTVLGVLLAVVTAALLIMLIWMAWIRRQYAFGKGGMMERVHQFILSNLDFDGHGEVLEVGCGSGALIVRTALTWPEAKITGLDCWGAMYNYSKSCASRTPRPRAWAGAARSSTETPTSSTFRTSASTRSSATMFTIILWARTSRRCFLKVCAC